MKVSNLTLELVAILSTMRKSSTSRQQLWQELALIVLIRILNLEMQEVRRNKQTKNEIFFSQYFLFSWSN